MIEPQYLIVVPDDALLFDSSGMQVAVLDQQNRVHLRSVAIARDFGTSSELMQGLSGGERLVLNLPADVGEGGRVKPAPAQDRDTKPTAENRPRINKNT